MSDENYNFTQARTRLEEIVTQVRSKDVSLEKSLDLLEEGVRLANICTEQSDHTEWQSVVSAEGTDESSEQQDAPDVQGEADEDSAGHEAAADDVVEEDGEGESSEGDPTAASEAVEDSAQDSEKDSEPGEDDSEAPEEA